MQKRIRFSLDRAIEPTAPDGSPEVKYGILGGDTVFETASLFSGNRGPAHPFATVRLLPPCWPSKIVCVGRNYSEHAAELGNEVPKEPLIFLKPPSSLIADRDDIVYPPISQRVDHEAELGVIIGRRARKVSRAEASSCIYGYTCVNDITARDLQRKDEQWTRAKGFDTFCSVGPWIVPADAVPFDTIRVRAFVNGQKKQDAPVTQMICPIPVLIEYISQFMTLEPGDLVATGTPSGISSMQPGDVVRVQVEGVGEIENRIVKA